MSDTIPLSEIAERMRWSMRGVYAALHSKQIRAFRVGKAGKGRKGAFVVLRSHFEAYERRQTAGTQRSGN